MRIDLYRLEQLIVVAEEGSITRAAARLHLSQQAVSTSLRALEREVGVSLLDRSGPHIRLLPAGEMLVSDARVLMGVANSALERARRVGRGDVEVLHVGHTPAVTGDEVAELVRSVHRLHPDLRIEPHQRYPSEIREQLLDGALDLGLCRAMRPIHGIARRTVARNRLAVAVSAEHRFADRDCIAISDLADETILVWGPPGGSGYTDLLITLCRQDGIEPKTALSQVQGVSPATTVVATGYVAFVTAPPGPAAEGAARVITLDPPIHVPLIALWLEHGLSDAREAFVRTLQHTMDAAAEVTR